MNEKVFISGSRSIKKLNKSIYEFLNKLIEENCEILVGDANGVDSLVQKFFAGKKYFNVTVCFIYNKPRNLLSTKFKLKRIDANEFQGRKAQERKDIYMTENCNNLVVIWDGKSMGSYNNIKRGLIAKKQVRIFLK